MQEAISQEQLTNPEVTFQDPGTEYSVIGYLILNMHESERYLAKLSVDDFTDEQPRGIIKEMLRQYTQDGKPDERKMVNILRNSKVLESYEDFRFYKDAATRDIDWGVKHLKSLRSRRMISDHLSQEMQNVYDLDIDVEGVLNRLTDLPNRVVKDAAAVSQSLRDVEQEFQDQKEPELIRIDDPIFERFYDNSCRKGFVEGILGRTGHGKTRYAHKRAIQMVNEGQTIAWFQLEGDKFETLQEMKAINRDSPDDSWMDRVFVQDSYYLLSDIMREIRILCLDHDIDAVFIDYLQEITAEGYRPSDVRLEKSHISRSLRRLAKELDIFMVWLLQPSREEKHSRGWGNQPKLSDIIETSQIEKDCYIVNGVFRPNMSPDLVTNEKVKWYDDTLMPYHSIVIQQLKNRKSARKQGGVAPG
jgi:replicative DNA helicase